MRLPIAVGVKVTVIEQVAPGPTPGPQVFVSAKSAESAPEIEISVMLNVELPLFVSVTFLPGLVVPILWLPKFKLAGLNCTTVPVPVRLIV